MLVWSKLGPFAHSIGLRGLRKGPATLHMSEKYVYINWLQKQAGGFIQVHSLVVCKCGLLTRRSEEAGFCFPEGDTWGEMVLCVYPGSSTQPSAESQ